MQKNEFCLNFYTAVLNTNLSDHGIVEAYSGDAVINSDWVSAGTVVYKVLNGTCFVDFDITVKQITAVNTLIVSGLPESTIVLSLMHIYCSVTALKVASTASLQSSGLCSAHPFSG